MKTIKEIALALIIVMAIFSQSFYIAQAQVAPSGIPFGGIIGVFVPASNICPYAHSLIFDLVSLQAIGVAVIGSSQVYRNGNITTPGIAILGTYIPAPLPCLVPYPVLPISQVGTQ